ncbi:glycosyltransferase [Bacillus subtilis]|uniref:glycosyltransferase n=1 Tax=Bacillus subtilis TaxID=1423 RepID=UPI000C757FD0|nr:glycosyltransferase [Bacillus subtilis]MCO8150756.1 glycosyltransferase [Bacillus subtilis]MDQ4708880.1 glycosyltransferase [Bacillus subtilis]MEC2179252.1 glycosyltransferase [Bacillus subtilis]
MRKKVCMFVWNHFTNDARVLRECTALSDQYYDVDLICIHDPNNPDLDLIQKYNDHFTVYRVKRSPLLCYIQFIYKLFKNKWSILFFLLIWICLLRMFPLLTIGFSLFAVIVLKTKLKTMLVRGSIIMRMILKGYSKKYDIYHSNDLNTLPQGFICSKFRFKKRKLIYDSHEVQTSRTGYDSPFYSKMEAYLIRKIDIMIVENHTRAAYNKELYGFYPKVLHNYPFLLEETKEQIDIHHMLGLPKNEKILLYQGGIQVGRGLDKLIKAMPFINEGTLLFIGDGRIKKDLENMVNNMELQHRVRFLPKVPLSELPKYTRSAYLGFQVLNNVCFNHYSASSNKLFEYIMAGVPVIGCDFPEIKKVIQGEKVGLVVDSHDHLSIAKGVNTLLENADLHYEFHKNCDKAKRKYNWETEKSQLLSLYN